jgi:hypothetical protein
MRRPPRPDLALGLCFVVSLLFGCQKTEEPKPVVAPAPPAPQAAAPFQVTRIDLGSAVGADKKVSAPTTTFKPVDTIYASILSEGAAPSVVLAARWTYGDGQLVSESSQTIVPSGPAATEFHIAKPDGWPAGKYKVEVAANGKPAGTREFTVSD